jgi:hypothetical protein
MGRLTEFIYGPERGGPRTTTSVSRTNRGGSNTGNVSINIDPRWLEKVYDKLNPILEAGAKQLMEAAKAKAPYDPDSRRASGKRKKTDNFPQVHHRDSIYMGEVDDTKRRKMAAEKKLFFNTKPGLLKSYFVRSYSGRGWWLEKGTKGLSAGMAVTGSNYLSLIDTEKTKKGKARAARLIKRQLKQIAAGKHPHYATPKQPHFLPASKAAIRKIKAQVKNLI